MRWLALFCLLCVAACPLGAQEGGAEATSPDRAKFDELTSEHDAVITGAEGSVPPEHQALNDGQTQVTIPLETVEPDTAIVPSGILVGGGIELSLAIVGPSPNAAVTTDLPMDFLAGSLMLGVWPSLLVAEEGLVINVPGGLAYRFH